MTATQKSIFKGFYKNIPGHFFTIWLLSSFSTYILWNFHLKFFRGQACEIHELTMKVPRMPICTRKLENTVVARVWIHYFTSLNLAYIRQAKERTHMYLWEKCSVISTPSLCISLQELSLKIFATPRETTIRFCNHFVDLMKYFNPGNIRTTHIHSSFNQIIRRNFTSLSKFSAYLFGDVRLKSLSLN